MNSVDARCRMNARSWSNSVSIAGRLLLIGKWFRQPLVIVRTARCYGEKDLAIVEDSYYYAVLYFCRRYRLA